MSAAAMSGHANHALAVIRAQQRADELLRRVQAGEIDSEDLAIAISPMYGEQLLAVCRAIVKALQ